MKASKGKLAYVARAIASLLLVIACAMALPVEAWALTWKKDGVTSIGAADCVIVANFKSPTSVKVTGDLKRDGNNLYAVYAAPNGGGAWSADGSVTLTYNKGLLDNRGVYHTLYVKICDVKGSWESGLTTSPKKSKVRQRIGYLSANFIAVRSYADEITYNGTVVATNAHSTGTGLGIYAWTDSTGAGLAYNLMVKDIDQPNYLLTPDAYSGAWQERVGLRSSELKGATVHVEKNTYLTYSSNVIAGTKSADSSITGSPYTAAFSAALTLTGTEPSGSPAKGFAMGWTGSRCETRIFEDLSHAIVTKAGKGGTCQQVAGTNASSTPIALAQKSVSDGAYITRTDLEAVHKNDYVVTVTPKAGYEIDKVTLDGKTVAVSSRTGMSVPISDIVADHTVTATFRALPNEPEPEPEPGTLSLLKTSAMSGVTQDNPCYSLEGARYGVYEDQACTSLVQELVTAADGTGGPVQLDAGSYWVRELTASPGYLVDRTTHEVTLSEGAEHTLEVTESPVMAPAALSLQKVDADTGTSTPQGSATLSGATFTARFYAGYYASVEELPEAATRQWDLTTDETGRACLDDEHLVQGDELYLDSTGAVTVPLGTLVVEESQPPAGYRLPSDPLVLFAQAVMTDEGACLTGRDGQPSAEAEVAEPVARGGVVLAKAGPGLVPLAGAVFSLTNASDHAVSVDGSVFEPGAVCLAIETGQDGIARSTHDALPCGRYVAREQQPPRGWRADDTWEREVTITEDGQIVDLSQDPLVDEPITVDVVLTATKRFDGSSQGRQLAEGMFSFALSDEQGVIDTQTNDAEGAVTFKALTFGYEDLGQDLAYTIKELAGDDEEIVYDDHVEEVSVRLSERPDGSLAAEVLTDDDGVVFENHTVERISLPVTGQGGAKPAGTLAVALVALTLLGLRRAARMR